MTTHSDTVWEFRTARFRVALELSPEDMDPDDSFEFPEDIEAVRSGAVEWFAARVAVYVTVREPGRVTRELELGSDSLGGCAYRTVREFYTAHRDPDPMNRNCSIMRAVRGERTVICHYFPGIVSEAIKSARTALSTMHAEPETADA